MSATVREARMIEQPGHLPPKVAKRPEGVNRNERRTRPAAVATIEVADLRALQTSRKSFVSGLEGGRILRPPFVFQLRERMAPAMPPPATPMARSLKYAVKGSCWPESSA